MLFWSLKDILNKLLYVDRIEVSQGSKQNLFEIQLTRLPKYFIRQYPENDSNQVFSPLARNDVESQY